MQGFKVFTQCLFLMLVIQQEVFCANILFVSGVASPSHSIFNWAVAHGLVRKGHNVTFLGPDQDKTPSSQNYTFVLLEGTYEDLDENFSMNEMTALGTFAMLEEFKEWSLSQCRKYYKSRGLRSLWDYPDNFQFDLLIFDVTIGNCLFPLMSRFNYPPTVGITAYLLPSYISYNFGNHLHPSYLPWHLLTYSVDMHFFQRVKNVFFAYYDVYLRNTGEYLEGQKIAEDVLEGNLTNPPNWEKLERHISLVLSNTDPILDVPQPLPPNIIPVGGLHTRKSKKLPNDLQISLDKSPQGVIVFSLGTNIRCDKLDAEHQRALLEAFSQVPQTVVWKFESDIEDLPKNVIVRKWLPQNDILGHPNVKLFIGHGGGLSTQEAIFHGVPMIAIPFLFDQFINAEMIKRKKLGVAIDVNQITLKLVLDNIREVLSNPMYSKNMKEASRRFKDQPETPLERAIFWIEYVLRHKGADFLSSPARDMPFYRSSGADVILFLLATICGCCIMFLLGVVCLLSCFSGASKTKLKST